jgi:hypothetical protein
MADTFRISVDDAQAIEKLRRIKSGLTLSGVDKTVRKVAYVTHRRLIQQTPKKWTGMTRRSWRVYRRGAARYSVTNRSKVMVYLERGTRAHGPKRAKMLFIPRTRKAALAGAGKVLDGVKNGSFVPGRDFVLAKRVRGIKAMRIVEKYRPFARITLKAAMRLHVRKLIEL